MFGVGMSDMELSIFELRPLYLCDSLKNKRCPAYGCGIDCFATCHKEFCLNGIRIHNQQEYEEFARIWNKEE